MLGENETKTGKKTMESFRVAKVRNLWCGNGSDGDKTRSKRNGSRNGGRRALGLRKTNERENAEIRRRKPGEALQDGGESDGDWENETKTGHFQDAESNAPEKEGQE